MATTKNSFVLSVSPSFGEPHRDVAVTLTAAGKNAHGPVYAVLVDGKRLGRIEKGWAAMERRSRGARAVTKRWRSQRWVAFAEDPMQGFLDLPQEKRAEAAQLVVEEWLRRVAGSPKRARAVR